MSAASRRACLCGTLLLLGTAMPWTALRAQAREVDSIESRIEISFLLGFVDGSGCEFYRNGSWHAAPAAQVHLREKYEWLRARKSIASAEDFIEKAATRSSLTGEAYAVRCGGGATVASATWLRAELARLRGG